jgi:hypothetical protein
LCLKVVEFSPKKTIKNFHLRQLGAVAVVPKFWARAATLVTVYILITVLYWFVNRDGLDIQQRI